MRLCRWALPVGLAPVCARGAHRWGSRGGARASLCARGTAGEALPEKPASAASHADLGC